MTNPPVVGGSPADTQIQLSKYINGEAIDGTDVVLWYAGHFTHDAESAVSSSRAHRRTGTKTR